MPLEKLLSKRSKAGQDEATCGGDPESADAEPVELGNVAQLRKEIEELASQNSELSLKVKVRRVRMHRLMTLITVHSENSQVKCVITANMHIDTNLVIAEDRLIGEC